MKLTIEPTPAIVSIAGVPCRVWEGTSAKGVHCLVFVRVISVEEDADCSEFDARLCNLPRPDVGVPTIDEYLGGLRP